jgi:hypothetical protein
MKPLPAQMEAAEVVPTLWKNSWLKEPGKSRLALRVRQYGGLVARPCWTPRMGFPPFFVSLPEGYSYRYSTSGRFGDPGSWKVGTTTLHRGSIV